MLDRSRPNLRALVIDQPFHPQPSWIAWDFLATDGRRVTALTIFNIPGTNGVRLIVLAFLNSRDEVVDHQPLIRLGRLLRPPRTRVDRHTFGCHRHSFAAS